MADDSVLESVLLDVAGMDLSELDALPDPVLQQCLRRILADSGAAADHYAAFQSSL